LRIASVRKIGVTGNIGCGKSTVARIFQSSGARIIEGDILGREVAEESPQFREWLKQRYGSVIFDGDTLNRARLGQIVFKDKQARKDLDQAIWQPIREKLEARAKQALIEGQKVVVDAALIYEWNHQDFYDLIIVVLADPIKSIERAAKRMKLSREEIADRYRMQIPAEEKARRADIILLNDGTVKALENQAIMVWKSWIDPTDI